MTALANSFYGSSNVVLRFDDQADDDTLTPHKLFQQYALGSSSSHVPIISYCAVANLHTSEAVAVRPLLDAVALLVIAPRMSHL